MKNIFVNFDFFSKRISFFFKEKEKIATFFGLILSLLYILFALAFFAIHVYYIIKRVNVKVYDSTTYSKDNIPYININPNLISFAFGLEDPLTNNRFIDKSIYYPKIYFYDKTKINGEYNITEKKELEYEICQKANFGVDFENILEENEINSSYCLKDYNISLIGGYNYDRMSYITINIYPCRNTSENEILCQPQNVIDSYLNGGFISLLAKDIGLSPSNFSFPVMPSLKYLRTAIDQSLYKEFNIYYSITEINTDISFFAEKLKKEKYLQFSKEYETFFFRNENNYYNDNKILSITIGLEDKIHIQKRSYSKINEVFFILGGYMYLLYTLFTLLALTSNSLIPELKILNGIFNFNLKEKKMTLRIHSIKDFNSIVFKKNLYFPSEKQISNLNTKIPNNNNNNVSKNSLIGCDNNDNNSSQVNIFGRRRNSLVIIKENENENEKNNSFKRQSINQPICHFMNNKFQKIKNTNNSSSFNNNNKNNNDINNNNNNSNNNTNNQNQKKNKYIYRVGSFFPKLLNNNKSQSSNSILKEFFDQVHFNMFEYYCFKYCSRKRKDIELYDSGMSLYRKRMDIVNVFSLLLFSEKNCLQAEDYYL